MPFLRKMLIVPVVLALSFFLPLHSPSAGSASSSQPRPAAVAHPHTVRKKKKPVKELTAAQEVAFARLVRTVELKELVVYLNAIALPACGTNNPLGGPLPSCCTMRIESHDDPWAVEPGHMGVPYGDPGDPWSHASGKWQFEPGTWNHFDGYPYAAAAPVYVQNEKAVEVFAGGAGASNWYGDGCYSGG